MVVVVDCLLNAQESSPGLDRAVGRSEKANGKAKIGVGAEINIELLGGTDRVVVTDPDPNRFGFG